MGYKTQGTDYPKFFGLSGIALSRMIGFAAGAGFLLFGYDQGVMGGLLTLPSFVAVFPAIDTAGESGTSHASTLQGVAIGLYEIGCFIGAVSCLWFGDMFGRRPIIWVGTVIMIIGAAIQASSFSLAQLIVARIITGVGNGMHTATIPVWQSECSPPHKRGMLIMIEGALITGGICMSYWIDFAFYWIDPSSRDPNFDPANIGQYPHASAAWRIPIAFQILLCIPTFITIWMPESPRWLMLKGREEDARAVLASLDEVPLDDPIIELKVKEIKDSIAEAAGVGVATIFKQGKERNFHRTALGFVIQMYQQISGINLITYYAATIFQTNIGMTPLVSRIVAAANGTEYFLASWIAVYTIERFGRRNLMIYSAFAMSASMAILTGTTSPAALKPDPVTNESTNKAPAYVATVFLFLFNTFFAIGWLGMTWLYPAEITPLSIRAAANGISTSANWLFNFMVVLITPIAFATIGYKTYSIFAVINFFIAITSWWIFPETAGRSLEEMDHIFSQASTIDPYDVVRIEKKTPRRYDTSGKLLALDNVLSEEGHTSTQKEKADPISADTASAGSSR